MDRPEHVCVLTTAHPLDDVRVNSKIAASFVDKGCRVSWIGPDTNFFTPEGARDERIEYVLTGKNSRRIDRLRSPGRVKLAARSVSDVDWYYCPEPDSAEIAVELARGTGARVLLDIHELYHGALLDSWLFGRKATIVREYVKARIARACRASDLVMGVSESVLQPYTERQPSRIVVRNCAPRWFASGPPSDVCGQGRKTLTIMHGKGLANNGTAAVLDSLAIPPESVPVSVVLFPRLTGGELPFAPEVYDKIASLGVGRSVQLLDPVTHHDMPGLLARCDVGLIAYGRGLGEGSLPNRIFEYMAAGLAVIVPSYARELKKICDAEGIGLAVDTEDPRKLAEAFAWLAHHPEETRAMGRRAREAFLLRHNWDLEYERLLAAMSTATKEA